MIYRSLVVRINEWMTVQNTNLFRDLGIGTLSANFSNKSNVCPNIQIFVQSLYAN